MSGQIPLNAGFILTPHQQNLLFAALSSNKPASQSPHNSVLSLPPTALDQSPHQNMDDGLAPDSTLLGYDDYPLNPDSSYDFDASGLDTSVLDGQMIGDLPGTTASSNSDSPASPDLHEKRSRPEDEAEQEGSPKRRESTEKVPKKPGRKPLTTEPSSKRKAQNRAAQRAFRERKEKHLKDLENKVEELQKVSESASNENEKLKAQIEQMTAELKEYKKRISLLTNTRSLSGGSGFGWGNAAVSNLNDVNFQFEFPKFGALPGPSPTAPSNKQRSPSQVSKDSHTSPRTMDSNSPSNSMDGYGRSGSHSADPSNGLGGLFGAAFTGNSMATSTPFSTFDTGRQIYSHGTTSSPSASSASHTGPTSSCGTSPEPFTQSPMGYKSVDTMTTIGEERTSIAQPTTGVNSSSSHLGSFDIGSFDWLSGQNSFDPQLFGDYREPQDNILASGVDDSGFFNDAFDIDFLTPYNVPESIAQPKKDILAELDAQKMDDPSPMIPAAKPPANFSGKLLTCHKIWEKIQNCPKVQNQDVDLDMLCKDLKEKAKCTGNGPVVNEKDFKDVIRKYVKAECASDALQQDKQPEQQQQSAFNQRTGLLGIHA